MTPPYKGVHHLRAETRGLLCVKAAWQAAALIANAEFVLTTLDFIFDVDLSSAMLGRIGDQFVQQQANGLDSRCRHLPFVTPHFNLCSQDAGKIGACCPLRQPVQTQETPAIVGYVQNGTQERNLKGRVLLLTGGGHGQFENQRCARPLEDQHARTPRGSILDQASEGLEGATSEGGGQSRQRRGRRPERVGGLGRHRTRGIPAILQGPGTARSPTSPHHSPARI